MPKIQSLEVRTRGGYSEFYYHNASASQVNQVLERIQNDLRAILGHYRWYLERHAGQYKIIAHSPQGTFTEAIGKSPSKALQAFGPARRILWEKYRIHP